MNALYDLLLIALTCMGACTTSVEYGTADYAYAIASIPPTSTATTVQVYIDGQISAECSRTSTTVLCSTAIVPVDAPPWPEPLEGFRALDIDVIADGEWQAEIYTHPRVEPAAKTIWVMWIPSLQK